MSIASQRKKYEENKTAASVKKDVPQLPDNSNADSADSSGQSHSMTMGGSDATTEAAAPLPSAATDDRECAMQEVRNHDNARSNRM